MSFPGGTVHPYGSGYDRLPITVGDETHLVERAMMVQIKTYLEQECEREETVWAQRDQDFANTMGIPYIPLKIERVQPTNFFVGARPSLVATSIDFWPSVTTRAATSKPSSDQLDQLDILDVTVDVEVLCKYGPVPQAYIHEREGIDAMGEANKQIQRLSAAIHSTVRIDPSLGGVVLPVQRPPVRSQGLPMAVPGVDKEHVGDYYVYIGRRSRYVFQVNTY